MVVHKYHIDIFAKDSGRSINYGVFGYTLQMLELAQVDAGT